MERFEYPTGTLAGGSGGTGFAGAYTGGGRVVTPGLGYTDPVGAVLAVAGQAGRWVHEDEPGFRVLQTQGVGGGLVEGGKYGADGSTMYLGFLMARTRVVDAGWMVGGMSLFDGDQERLFIGQPFGQSRLGLDLHVADGIRISGVTTGTRTHRLVVRVDFGPGSEQVRLYVNPPLGAEPGTPTLGPFTVPDFRFDRLRWFGWFADFTFDEVRLGGSYGAAMGPGNHPPGLAALPTQTVRAGERLALTLVASDPDGAGQRLTFGFDGTPPAGATLDAGTGAFAWTPTDEQAGRTHAIGVRVTDDGTPTLSAGATLTVSVEARAPVVVAPVIVQAPADLTVVEGETVRLTVVAEGTAPLQYQWLRQDQPMAGATNAVLEMANARVAQGGTYAVRVSNSAGTVTSRVATVSVVGGFRQVQEIPLGAGWNLVSIQVGPSFSLADLRSAMGNRLVSVWAYDATARDWLYYHATDPTHPHTLTTLEPGRGYWLHLTGPHTLTLTGQVWNGRVGLKAGWNLVGFPGLQVGSETEAGLASVFRSHLDRVPQVWTWEGGAAQRFVGHDTEALPALTDLETIQPGRGYWVRSLESLDLEAQPEILLPPDLDLPPLAVVGADGRRPAGPEDTAAGTDLNRNGLLDDAFTQDTLHFPAGMETRWITLANAGLGRLDWQIFEDIPWLDLDRTAGVVASGNTVVEVRVRREGLSTGTYTAAFPVRLGNLDRTVRVRMDVAPVDGDYRGQAVTLRVNGSPVSLGKVDLHLTLFRETQPGRDQDIRAVIGRERSLLFPRDVFLSGTFIQGNDFFLTTNFEVPPGDRNQPPFDVFSDGHAYSQSQGTFTAEPDLDLNRDGRLDNANPFPFALRREITLIGRRLDENRLRGTYYESLQNILPGDRRISIEGEFELERQSYQPTLTSIYNRSLTTNTIIGANSPAAITNTFQVPVPVSVQGVRLSVDLDFALGSNVLVTLVAPGGTRYQVDNEAFRGRRTYDLPAFNQTSGEGDWQLIISWLPNGERGFFQGWSLGLQGIAVHAASGRVVAGPENAPVPLLGARVTLTGNNFVEQRLLSRSSDFAFSSLTENDFLLTVSRVGYQDAVRRFSIVNTSTNLGDLRLLPLTNTEPALLAGPWIGGQPLTVNFSALLPLATLNNLGAIRSNSWSFGDGTTNVVFTGEATTGVEHTFTRPGYYVVTNRIHGANNTLTLVSPRIHVLPQGPHPGLARSLWGGAFVGSLASPVQPLPLNVSHVTPTDRRTTNQVIVVGGTQVTVSGVATGTLYQESQRDSAGFDLDRHPRGNFGAESARREDTDFFVEPMTSGNGAFDLFPRLLVANHPTNRFRIVSTMGGTVFGKEPSRMGPFVLQAGRGEP